MEFKSQLMTTDEIMRALRRIAHQITERNNGTEDVVIVGIAKGGVPIANQLSEFLKLLWEWERKGSYIAQIHSNSPFF